MLLSLAVVLCPILTGLDNGRITTVFPPLASSAVVGSEAVHECNTGYYLVGNSIRNCTSDGLSTVGTWDGSPPICASE